MRAALEEAKNAFEADEVPVGAVLVHHDTGEIVASAFNQTRTHSDPCSHAEALVIRAVCKKEQSQRIPDYDLYVTLEPCPMCASLISFARIKTLVFGASDPKSGGITHGPKLYTHSQLHHKPDVRQGVLVEESAKVLQSFFREKRKN